LATKQSNKDAGIFMKCPDCGRKLIELDFENDEDGATHHCKYCQVSWLITLVRED